MKQRIFEFSIEIKDKIIIEKVCKNMGLKPYFKEHFNHWKGFESYDLHIKTDNTQINPDVFTEKAKILGIDSGFYASSYVKN